MTRKLLAALLALLMIALPAMAEADLTVQGTATVLMDADRATIRVGVRDNATEVLEAQRSVNARIDAIVEALCAKGIAREDISTDSIGIYPNYDYSGETERITGYTAFNTISAVTADIENAGQYIDAAFEAGANTLDGVIFSASDTQDAYNQALAQAYANALSKAGALSAAMGMKLGDVDAVREGASGGYSGPVLYAKAESTAADSTRVLASQLQISATVEVEFELVKGD